MFRFRWLCVFATACTLYGVDGVVLIDQNRALAGNVTPGDTPGFPVTITQPGSYRLSGNLTVPDANTTAIVINASDVTLDLNGFSIVGPTVCTKVRFDLMTCSPLGTGVGIYLDDFRENNVIINGSIKGMGSHGIYTSDLGVGIVIERIRAHHNGGAGIRNGYLGSIVSHNTATRNGGDGIFSSLGTVTNNAAGINGAWGLNILCASSVVGNSAFSNVSGGIALSNASCATANNVSQ